MAGFVIGLGVWAFCGGAFWDARLVLLGLVGALSYIVTLWAYLLATRERDIAANWTVVNLSVVIPIMVSVAWFHDDFGLFKAAGVTCTLVSILVIGGGFEGAGGRGMTRWAKAIVVAFLFNAWLPVLFRFVPAGSEALFTVYFHGLSVPMLLAYKFFKRGGITEGRKIASLAADRGLPCVNHGFTTYINVAAALHFLASNPNSFIMEYVAEAGM